VRRVNVKGISCSGKSTFARALAERLELPYLELDSLNHRPNWTEASSEELEAHVREFMAGSANGWVVDGNYEAKLGDLVVDAADTIVWLDPPLHFALRRMWRRTRHRIRDRVELWGGNRETWRTALLGWNSLPFWTIRAFLRHRRQWPTRFASDRRLVRLRSAADARRWLEGQGAAPKGR
jgi:adenylate kinase family enzyme